MTRRVLIFLTALLFGALSQPAHSQSIAATVAVGSFALSEAVDATHGLLHVVNQGSGSVSTMVKETVLT